MKRAIFQLLSVNFCQAYYRGCIKSLSSLGPTQGGGELIDDFDLLDRYTDDDMRLSRTEFCEDEDEKVTMINLTLQSESDPDRVLRLS